MWRVWKIIKCHRYKWRSHLWACCSAWHGFTHAHWLIQGHGFCAVCRFGFLSLLLLIVWSNSLTAWPNFGSQFCWKVSPHEIEYSLFWSYTHDVHGYQAQDALLAGKSALDSAVCCGAPVKSEVWSMLIFCVWNFWSSSHISYYFTLDGHYSSWLNTV